MMDDIMIKKKEVLPELKAAYKFAKERATEARAADGQQGKLTQLKHEYAWAFVVEVEDVGTLSARSRNSISTR